MSSTTDKPQQRAQVVFVAAHDDFETKARHWLKDFPHLEFVASPSLEKLSEGNPIAEIQNAKLVLLDGRADYQKTLEWTQMLKIAFNTPLVVFYDSTSMLEFAFIKKNGADVLLHTHYDAEFIVDKLIDLVHWEDENTPPLGLLNPLAIEDLSLEMDLNFDLYVHLPGNQKSILVRRKGTALDEKLVDKVKASQQNVYFKKSQLKQFLEYSRTALSLNNSTESIGVTDKVLKTRQRIQQIISEFFDENAKDYKSGKVIFENCEKIIEEFEIRKWTTPQQAWRTIVQFSGRPRTYYNDVISLTIFAAGFAYLLDKKPEEITELALAAMLHNIGLATLTKPVLNPDVATMSEEDKVEYLHYPEKSVVKIKSKKVPLPPAVSDLILQHREKPGGGGFPRRNASVSHHPLSRILQLAVTFLELTQLENNQAKYTIRSAFSHLQELVMQGSADVDSATLLLLKKKIDSLTGGI
jgi:response regulator RpfG family c-di-GMP phosphodiesterase